MQNASRHSLIYTYRFLCRSLMWERTWWYQMSLRQRSTWRGCGGDIWLQVEELEPCLEPSLRRSTDSKSSCRYEDHVS